MRERESKRENWVEREGKKASPSSYRSNSRKLHREFTVFVNNLPQNLDRHGLKGIFQKAGGVSDSYTPIRRSIKTRSRYGFVRFKSRHEAIKSLSMLNNTIVHGSKIQVSLARFEKRRKQPYVRRWERITESPNHQRKWR